VSKTYFITYTGDDDDHLEMEHNLSDVRNALKEYFKRNYEDITVWEAREMDINIDISISTKTELPF